MVRQTSESGDEYVDSEASATCEDEGSEFDPNELSEEESLSEATVVVASDDDQSVPEERKTGSDPGAQAIGTGAYYLQLEAAFDESADAQRLYSMAFMKLQDQVKRCWQRYCEMTQREAIPTLRQLDTAIGRGFLDWMLRTRSASLRSASSLQTYWNALCVIYSDHTGGSQLSLKTKTQMKAVRAQLVKQHKLNTKKKTKTIVRVEDEFELLKTLWTSPDVTFDHERQRVQLALFFQIAGITGNRPGAIIALQYKHVKVTLLRDPAGSETPRVLVELSFEETKGYLGPKDTNTFGIPDVQNEPCLVLCPQITLLSLAFADRAFAVPELSGPEPLFRLQVPSRLNQLELSWKNEVLDQPLFRGLERSVRGFEVSKSRSATANWMRKRIRQVGEITGFVLPVGPYCFRRGNGEALDSSNAISDAQRNVVLQHASSTVFQQHYLSRYITADTQAAFRKMPSQTDVMRAASGMSRSIDPCRPRGPPIGQDIVQDDKELRRLRDTRDGIAQEIRKRHGAIARAHGTDLHAQYEEAQKIYNAKKVKKRRAALVALRRTYEKQQPLTDVTAQLQSASMKEEAGIGLLETPPLSDARQRAVDCLFAFAAEQVDDDHRRRRAAITALVSLAARQERAIRPQERARTASAEPAATSDNFPIVCDPLQCLFCLGETSLASTLRFKKFYSRGTLKRHWEQRHLRQIVADDPLNCPHPRCHARLEDVGHLRNHAMDVHNTPT